MISQEPLHTEIYMKNAQNADTHFARAYAVETHVKISYAALFTKIYRQQVAEESDHPDQAPTFASTVRTPQCRHTVWARMFLHSSRQINSDLQPNILSNTFSLTHILVLSPARSTIFSTFYLTYMLST